VAEFVFATCLPGLEPAIKREVARTRPELRFAYSRPGLLTFKAPGAIGADDPPGAAFARVWGRSVGVARDPDAARVQLAAARRLHVFARDPEIAIDPAWAALDGGPAEPGDLVGDVIVSPDGDAWLGLHVHESVWPEPGTHARVPWGTAGDPARPRYGRSPLPGGGLPADLPAEAGARDASRAGTPATDLVLARAYATCEEAIAWAGLPVERGHVALEIGAAPGGAVLALARRGLEVWAVDTGDLAPVVADLPNVHQLAIQVGALRWEALPPRIDWLLVDVNLAPQVALHEIARLMPRLRSTLRGAILTLKLNDWSFVDELPELVARIRELGLSDVALRHLPSNRREISAVARRVTHT